MRTEIIELRTQIRNAKKHQARQRASIYGLLRERKEIMSHMKWEYCVVPIRVGNAKVHTLLNEYGEEGWQLVQVVQEQDTADGGLPTKVCWFKRPVYKPAGMSIGRSKSKDQEVSHGGTTEGQNNA